MTNLPEQVKTISSESEFKLKEKGSTFISISKPIENIDEAITFLTSLKKKYYDATHHCYSYQLVDGTFKYSDDGEPSGTAGKRIFNAQSHFGLTDLITIVIRYYGGVKLGVGPLGKAYYDAAIHNLESSKTEEKFLHAMIEIEYEFEYSNLIHHLISKYQLIIQNHLFEPNPKLICLIRNSIINKFSSEVSSSSNSKILVKTTDQIFYKK
ncbi:MAG: YigZ family protein [Ignavibacteriales bacterium]|nr:YigZ family protein [Ignavibacteriales bacterium]